MKFPISLGFEGVFKVEDIGSEVKKFKIGDLVHLGAGMFGNYKNNWNGIIKVIGQKSY